MPHLADILLTLGPYRLSDLIGSVTQELPGKAFSHAALVIAESPLPLIIESVPPRVRVRTYATALLRIKHALLLSPRLLTHEQRAAIVEKALECEGALYGFSRYPALFFDSWLDVDWCARHLFLTKRHPVCSVLVSAAYETQGLDFGEPAQGVTPAEIFAFAVTHPDLYAITNLTAMP